MQECPVCGRPTPEEELAQCPQCNSNLQCFKLLDALQEPGEPTPARHPASSCGIRLRLLPVAIGILCGAVLILAAERWVVPPGAKVTPQVDTTALDAHLGELALLLEKMDKTLASASPPPSLPATPAEERFLSHTVADGETLWSIAETYYADGTLYPVLFEHNPGLSYVIGPRTGELRILKSAREARELFDGLSFWHGGQRFFRYKVREGDTWVQIAARFYRDTEQKVAALREWNPNVQLAAGDRILVCLE